MSLSVWTGPMFSGKTTNMISEVTHFCDISGLPAIIINYHLDTRDKINIVSLHSSGYRGLSDKIKVVRAEILANVNVDQYSIIGIDEACFFDDLSLVVKKWLLQGKNIVCAGLDGTFQMTKFGQISELLHIADKFTKLSAICNICLEELTSNGKVITPHNTVPAAFTKKLVDDGPIEDIGGSEKYIPVCRKHHNYSKVD